MYKRNSSKCFLFWDNIFLQNLQLIWTNFAGFLSSCNRLVKAAAAGRSPQVYQMQQISSYGMSEMRRPRHNLTLRGKKPSYVVCTAICWAKRTMTSLQQQQQAMYVSTYTTVI
jgi:hypothetical protein